jgi:hypothetical protein
MGADGEELDRRALVRGHARGAEEIAGRQRQQSGHPAVLMDAEHGELGAAVGLAVSAGDAGATGDVGIDHTDLAGGEAGAVGRLDHLDGELVAHDARVLEERVQALEDMIVGAADAHPPRAHQSLTGAGTRRRPLLEPKAAGLSAHQGIHSPHAETSRSSVLGEPVGEGRTLPGPHPDPTESRTCSL